jgi:hypothetical protein
VLVEKKHDEILAQLTRMGECTIIDRNRFSFPGEKPFEKIKIRSLNRLVKTKQAVSKNRSYVIGN